MSRGFKLFLSFSLFVGMMLIFGSIYSLINQAIFVANAVVTEGMVINNVKQRHVDDENQVSYAYYPMIQFNDRNDKLVKFLSRVGHPVAEYQIGDGVNVIYSPQNPRRAEINYFFNIWGSSIIIFIVGCVFTVIVLIFYLAFNADSLYLRQLKKNGIAIKTSFQGVQQNREVSSSGKVYYQICSQWQDPVSAKKHLFTSVYLKQDPLAYIPDRPITVYMAKDKPEKYAMDVSFLPKTLLQ